MIPPVFYTKLKIPGAAGTEFSISEVQISKVLKRDTSMGPCLRKKTLMPETLPNSSHGRPPQGTSACQVAHQF